MKKLLVILLSAALLGQSALLDLPLERILNTGDILVWRGSIEVLPLVCIGAYDDRLSSV